MSGLTPAGYKRMDYQTSRLAINDKERELAKYRPGDKNLMVWNTTAMNRMAQSKQTPSIAPPLGRSGKAKVRKEPLKNVPDKKIIKRGKDYRSRITSRVQTSGITKRPKASRANLGSRIAALLKPKSGGKKTDDKLG